MNGVTGSQAATGFTGAVGDTGPQGILGVTGIAVIGVTGSDGTTGTDGVMGGLGCTGPQGFIGVTGNTGPQGAVGDTGPVGVTGVTGVVSSATGVTGPQDGLYLVLDTNMTRVLSANFTGVFSSTYDNYLLLISELVPIVNGANYTLAFRLMTGSTIITTGYYYTRLVSYNVLNAARYSIQNGSAHLIATNGGPCVSAQWHEIQSPFLAKHTVIEQLGYGPLGVSGSVVHQPLSAWHNANTSYDGFNLYGDKEYSCRIQVYGYKK